MRILLALIAFEAPALGQGVETWNDSSYTVARLKRVSLSLEGTFRMNEVLSNVYDRRAAAGASVALTDGFSLEFAYVFRKNRPETRFLTEHRMSAGVVYPVWGKTWRLTGETHYERLAVSPMVKDFNRVRQRFELEHKRKRLAPWLHQDFTFRENRGFLRTRTRAGLQWRWAREALLRAAYQFESIETLNAWRPRHAVYTELSINRPFGIWE